MTLKLTSLDCGENARRFRGAYIVTMWWQGRRTVRTQCDQLRFYDPRVSLEWEQTIVDAHDPVSLGRWWCDVLGWVAVNEDPDEFEIRPSAERLPGLLFAQVSDPKVNKNRLHLDLRPDDRDAEVERLLALGAKRADVGQGEPSWVVLADPEGNEFCILSSRTTAG